MAHIPIIPLAVSADGTVSASTQSGTLVVELRRRAGATPEIVTRLQQSLASRPAEVARYPLRTLLALALRAMRASRGTQPSPLTVSLQKVPRALQSAHAAALSKFLSLNFRKLLRIARAAHRPPRRWPQLLPDRA
ncbi:MAG TPA: hypothetical protein VHA82_09635 [Ramlibacter sp.]|uniref:hypothetical protein n=1 Tax=Ramlibacter sp. TaxID=1917967 RepID=UPI002B5856FF|nr:hypothetical protein [Ramlibacter sp.]HVZ44061.1 hypothetical protein [Ramlibacter sp.]